LGINQTARLYRGRNKTKEVIMDREQMIQALDECITEFFNQAEYEDDKEDNFYTDHAESLEVIKQFIQTLPDLPPSRRS
jgi:hypothetical protein